MRQVKDSFLIFLRGMLMGIADTIPGVSGGTIAFITGIYSRLIHACSSINLSFISLFLKGKFKESWEVIKNHDWQLIIPLAAGIVGAILLFSKLMLFLLESYTSITFSFFAGLIVASAYVMYRTSEKHSTEKNFFGILGFTLAYLISGISAVSITHSAPMIFLSGFIAISAMLLPGISGSFLLLLLGQYDYVVGALHEFNISVIFIFCLGALIGLLVFSKFVDFLLQKNRGVTFYFLIGLMLGSLRLAYLKVVGLGAPTIQLILAFLLGLVLVIYVHNLHEKKVV